MTHLRFHAPAIQPKTNTEQQQQQKRQKSKTKIMRINRMECIFKHLETDGLYALCMYHTLPFFFVYLQPKIHSNINCISDKQLMESCLSSRRKVLGFVQQQKKEEQNPSLIT